MDDKRIEKEAEILNALAQPTRLKILYFLRDGEQCVCKITPAMPGDPSVTCRHLLRLKEAGILDSRKEGASVYYWITEPKVFHLLSIIDDICCSISRKIIMSEIGIYN